MIFALMFLFFFFNDTATTEIYTLSLHDALPIYEPAAIDPVRPELRRGGARADDARPTRRLPDEERGDHDAGLGPDGAGGGGALGHRAGRPRARGRRGPVRLAHARDHEPDRRRLDRVARGVGSA